MEYYNISNASTIGYGTVISIPSLNHINSDSSIRRIPITPMDSSRSIHSNVSYSLNESNSNASNPTNQNQMHPILQIKFKCNPCYGMSYFFLYKNRKHS